MTDEQRRAISSARRLICTNDERRLLLTEPSQGRAKRRSGNLEQGEQKHINNPNFQSTEAQQKWELADKFSAPYCLLRKISTDVHLASGTASQRRKTRALAIVN